MKYFDFHAVFLCDMTVSDFRSDILNIGAIHLTPPHTTCSGLNCRSEGS